jgi:ubiquinone/menaquinone biosynthesis C-methylase UbiE
MQNPASLESDHRLSLPTLLLTSALRLFFHLLYHQFAWGYDWVAWMVSLGAWKKWVLSVAPFLDGPKTLEIGFGPGHLQVALNRKGLTSFGLDESVQMTRIAKRRLSKSGLDPKVIRGNALMLPFADHCLNQVVMTFPSEYILNSATLGEIQRVLVNGGMAIMVPLVWITGKKPLERAAAWLNRISGEAPEWNEKSLDPIKKAGFMVSWKMIDFGSSKILMVRMVKPGSLN